jgi:hypothetical protein
MKNTGKVGNKSGEPKFRTPSTFIANQSLNASKKFDKFSVSKKGFNAHGGRSMKVFNRGKV